MAIIKIGDSTAEQTSRRSAVVPPGPHEHTSRGRIRSVRSGKRQPETAPADDTAAAVPFVPAFDLLNHGANKALPSSSELAAIASVVFYSRRLQRKFGPSGNSNWALIALKEGLR